MPRPRNDDGRVPDPLVAEIAAQRRHFGTQRKFAQLAGMKQSQISEFESGASSPNLTTLRRVLNALGFDLAIVERSDG